MNDTAMDINYIAIKESVIREAIPRLDENDLISLLTEKGKTIFKRIKTEMKKNTKTKTVAKATKTPAKTKTAPKAKVTWQEAQKGKTSKLSEATYDKVVKAVTKFSSKRNKGLVSKTPVEIAAYLNCSSGTVLNGMRAMVIEKKGRREGRSAFYVNS